MKNAVSGFIGVAAILLGLSAATVSAQTVTGDPKMGAKRAATCSGCHGISGLRNAYPEVFRIPMIGNQYPEYIAAALQAYRSGERSHPTMRAIASALSDQAIADLAAFYGQGGLRSTSAGGK